MDKGIVEGSEDTSDAKDHFTCNEQVNNSEFTIAFEGADLREPEGRGRYSPWRGVRPSFWEAS
jgi:hypothetical protein